MNYTLMRCVATDLVGVLKGYSVFLRPSVSALLHFEVDLIGIRMNECISKPVFLPGLLRG